MNRIEFGELIASLRDDLGWTQQQLAEHSGVDISIISNIERGQRKHLFKENILVNLADGLLLTSMERMEFMFAASGVSEHEKVRREGGYSQLQFNAAEFLKNTGEKLSHLMLPVYITDSFCDIVLATNHTLKFFNIPPIMLENAGNEIGGYNMMRWTFDIGSNFSKVVPAHRQDFQAVVSARYFRKRTLRVRQNAYFTDLIKELNNTERYPSFSKYWQRIIFEDSDDYTLPITQTDPDNDHEFATVETLFAITPYGELYLHQLLPLNRKTADRMNLVSIQAGVGYHLFSPFPDERKL